MIARLLSPLFGVSSPERPVVPVLMYHKIAAAPDGAKYPHHYVTPHRFEMHLRLLRDLGFETITLAQMAEGFRGGILPARPVVLSFDDAYENFYTEALPLLQKYEMTATVFVVTDEIGGENRWDTVHGDRAEKLMNADQIVECFQAGIEIGSHTRTHADLSSMTPSEALKDLQDSKQVLEKLLNCPVEWFCYPYGRYSEETVEMVRNVGYRGACVVDKYANTPAGDLYQVGRLNIRSSTGFTRFLHKLLGNLKEAR